jgi:hypothetical protein
MLSKNHLADSNNLLQINDLPMASFVGTDAAKQSFSL